jgi:hypothetical protein
VNLRSGDAGLDGEKQLADDAYTDGKNYIQEWDSIADLRRRGEEQNNSRGEFRAIIGRECEFATDSAFTVL